MLGHPPRTDHVKRADKAAQHFQIDRAVSVSNYRLIMETEALDNPVVNMVVTRTIDTLWSR